MGKNLLRHEAIDRTSMILDIIDSCLYDHPGLKQKDRALIDEAMRNLMKLYQKLGERDAKSKKHSERF